MNVRLLEGLADPELARALGEFEQAFTYPLGPGRSFRIAHGHDYRRFFRAIGRAVVFVAWHEQRVVGTLGVAIRRLVLPEAREQPVAYVGDLKLAPDVRGGRVLVQLAKATEQWVRRSTDAAFSVVMDGTRATPTEYTGRVGIPAFQEVGKVLVWRLPVDSLPPGIQESRSIIGRADVEKWYRPLSVGRYASIGGTLAERSEMVPAGLVHQEGLACGILEDTRKAKRLIAEDGSEMRSAHLSCFAFRTPQAAAELLAQALRRTAAFGVSDLFVSVVPADDAPLRDACRAAGFRIDHMVTAPATIFASGLPAGFNWNINTAEI